MSCVEHQAEARQALRLSHLGRENMYRWVQVAPCPSSFEFLCSVYDHMLIDGGVRRSFGFCFSHVALAVHNAHGILSATCFLTRRQTLVVQSDGALAPSRAAYLRDLTSRGARV
jgi:hypothetical protein